jgi:hypothetical protein
LADKIKAFSLPNHYLILRQLQNLLYQLGQVSSCSRLSLGAVQPAEERVCAPPPRPGEPGQRRVGCRDGRLAAPRKAKGAVPPAPLDGSRGASEGKRTRPLLLRSPPPRQDRSLPGAPHLRARRSPGARASRSEPAVTTAQARPGPGLGLLEKVRSQPRRRPLSDCGG